MSFLRFSLLIFFSIFCSLRLQAQVSSLENVSPPLRMNVHTTPYFDTIVIMNDAFQKYYPASERPQDLIETISDTALQPANHLQICFVRTDKAGQPNSTNIATVTISHFDKNKSKNKFHTLAPIKLAETDPHKNCEDWNLDAHMLIASAYQAPEPILQPPPAPSAMPTPETAQSVPAPDQTPSATPAEPPQVTPLPTIADVADPEPIPVEQMEATAPVTDVATVEAPAEAPAIDQTAQPETAPEAVATTPATTTETPEIPAEAPPSTETTESAPAQEALVPPPAPVQAENEMASTSEPEPTSLLGDSLGGLLNLLFALFTIFSPLICASIICQKCGVPFWHMLIPIWNVVMFANVATNKKIWGFLCFIPLVNFYAMWKISDGLAKRYGKGFEFSVGLFVLPMFFLIPLALTKPLHIENKNTEPSAAA